MERFKGSHSSKPVIMIAIRWYTSYSLSYREVEELLKERNISFNHATINRWVIKYMSMLEATFRKQRWETKWGTLLQTYYALWL